MIGTDGQAFYRGFCILIIIELFHSIVDLYQKSILSSGVLMKVEVGIF